MAVRAGADAFLVFDDPPPREINAATCSHLFRDRMMVVPLKQALHRAEVAIT